MKLSIEKFQTEFEQVLRQFEIEKVAERIWKNDFTVWSDKPDEITNRLGWLTSPQNSLSQLKEILTFVEEVRKEGFKKTLLLGMGGSSLAPEVFRLTFGLQEGYLDLAVLDSTDPQMILNYANTFDPKETLYIVSTKSGGTIETFSFMKYFYNLTSEKVGKENVGKHFIAITDPGSGLESTAKQLNYRKIFLNDPKIGGRYSALSLFGIVPAALIGVNVAQLLKIAEAFAFSSKENNSAKNPSAQIGILMGLLAKHGIDKVTFITTERLSYFGAWVEQLIAESTGKIGKGILPVVGEDILTPDKYSSDRLFVYIRLQNDDALREKVEAFQNTGHPIVEIVLDDIYELCAEFFRWEFATIAASWLLNIQPFDQPNVESAKIVARKMVQEYKENGKLPELNYAVEENEIKISSEITASSLKELVAKFLDSMNSQDVSLPKPYVSIHAYLTMNNESEKVLQIIRTKIQEKYKAATTIGFGPRFLHSTGQLHKGDAGNGLFIQFIYDSDEDVAIPDEAGEDKSSMSFNVLIKSQALGDRQALLENERRLITVDLGKEVFSNLKLISELI
ncbi:MAG: transaldolase / glucose-6-phosphate isomerase [Ignavibacteria bacterium]|nr:MAG: transaldolase / glucose-6-phosphate isomerase [Ignavibacteria bacterium]KAF0158317.1 MAG: transaldolase / glucose-6-phosphate isomerase [Ignavibacteria bacterium]